MRIKLIILVILPLILWAQDFKTITFPSKDSLMITADLYTNAPEDAPFILLFHRAHWSRGEYREIAPKLNKMGFNCIAIDQRSGKEVNGVKNETAALAAKLNLGTAYIDALPDLQATLDYIVNNYKPKKIIIWGSSYSSSLAFVLAAQNIKKVDGLLAFAPGEYFKNQGRTDHYIQDQAKKVTCPVFITSAKSEGSRWQAIFNAVPAKIKASFLPKTEGIHGSEALWEKTAEHKEYWQAVKEFMEKL